MKAIVTVIGKDKVGIVSEVSQQLTKDTINILDVSQTIMDQYFTMMMVVDLTASNSSFKDIKDNLTGLGEKIGVKISVQREDIFNTMHKL